MVLSCIPLCRIRPSALIWLRDWGGVSDSLGLGISWRAYLKRLIPAPSSHCGYRTLILCAGNLDPRMHWCVAQTKVMAILILKELNVLYYSCHHFVARRLVILFRESFSSTPMIPSTEATNGKKCRSCWKHESKYIFFLARYASWRKFSGVFPEWDLASFFMTRMLWTLSVPFYQKSLIRSSPFCSVALDVSC